MISSFYLGRYSTVWVTLQEKSVRIFLCFALKEALTDGIAGGLLGTAAEEGGQFLERQVEVNQPIVETVHNISDTIGGSEFVQGSTRTAPQLVGTKLGLAHSTAQVRS